jgi:hypothetical protein
MFLLTSGCWERSKHDPTGRDPTEAWREAREVAASIERVSVRVKDVNGPRGGIEQVCRIKVVLSDFPSVILEPKMPETQ